jgi:hypothetical protein
MRTIKILPGTCKTAQSQSIGKVKRRIAGKTTDFGNTVSERRLFLEYNGPGRIFVLHPITSVDIEKTQVINLLNMPLRTPGLHRDHRGASSRGSYFIGVKNQHGMARRSVVVINLSQGSPGVGYAEYNLPNIGS